MDYGNQVTKDMLRQLLDMTPNTAENQNTRSALIDLITSQGIIAKSFTYNAVYWLTGAFNGLAVGATNIPATMSIQADADFLILNQTYDANTANAARALNTLVIPNVNVVISDTGSSQQMMDVAVPVVNIFGTGAQPYILPAPKLVTASSTLQVLATNTDAAAGYNLRLSFNGVKLFKNG